MEGSTELSASRAYRIPIIIALVIGLVLFLPAGSLRYWEAWIYWLITFAFTLFIAAYFLKKSPEFLARRSQFKEKEPQPGVMRILSFLSVLSLLIPGLDYRFHWSLVPAWAVIVSDAFVFLGFVFIFVVFKENSYASTIIQVEQEQRVITTGPYAIVRHPMYAAVLLISLFTPLALGSYWALIYFLLAIPVNILRIKKEEEVLLRDLPGYRDYCLKTRYRLIPAIW
ncbi:MAG: isoprenylcysteine carboxylmethyltransferase family protein [Firmicutes bacterium]|nr:isoprenylcysteine carboxylmethyltransferase family protein [Bacillota bacterium]